MHNKTHEESSGSQRGLHPLSHPLSAGFSLLLSPAHPILSLCCAVPLLCCCRSAAFKLLTLNKLLNKKGKDWAERLARYLSSGTTMSSANVTAAALLLLLLLQYCFERKRNVKINNLFIFTISFNMSICSYILIFHTYIS